MTEQKIVFNALKMLGTAVFVHNKTNAGNVLFEMI